MAIDRRRTAGSGYLPLREAMDRLFEGSFITPQSFNGQGGVPQVDVHMDEEEVTLRLAVPGANPDDINISVTGDTVTVSGEVRGHEKTEKSQPYLEEIWKGSFQRSFTLPVQVDPNVAEASFDNGILTLRLPKSEATRPRKIQVKRQQATIQGESSQGATPSSSSAQGGNPS